MLKQLFLFSLICIVTVVIYARSVPHRVRRWEEMPNVTFTFDCTDRSVGFYADTEFNCNIFHMCDEDGRRIPHICANGTTFNQKFRICDWPFNVKCGDAPNWYFLNDQTYETDPPPAAGGGHQQQQVQQEAV
jgi:hypothetical protein